MTWVEWFIIACVALGAAAMTTATVIARFGPVLRRWRYGDCP